MKIINLLPKEKQREFYYRKIFRSVVLFIGISSVSFVMVMLFQFSSRLYMARGMASVHKEIERVKAVSNKEENAQLRKGVQDLNNQIADFNNLSKDAPKWSVALREFTKLVPESVYIQSFTVSIPKRQVAITGFAPKRELVIALYNNVVADSQHFSGIDYPLENVSRPSDVQFHFTFMIEQGVLQ